MLSYSPESNYKSKVKGKASGFPLMVGLSYWQMHEQDDTRNRCRYGINNVIKLCHCLSGSFFCFQALTAFALLATVYRCLLNKQCARINRSYSESHRRWAVPGDKQKGGWPSLPLGRINGRVAERQLAEQLKYLYYELWKNVWKKMEKKLIFLHTVYVCKNEIENSAVKCS
jgi:hypothetical protein